MATAFRGARCRAPRHQGAYFTAAPRATRRDRLRARARLHLQHGASAPQIQNCANLVPRRFAPRSRDQRSGSSITVPPPRPRGHHGGAGRRAAFTSTRCGSAPFRSRDSVMDFINAHDQVFVVEQNCGPDARMLVNRLEIRPAQLVGSCTTTARRSLRLHHRRFATPSKAGQPALPDSQEAA